MSIHAFEQVQQARQVLADYATALGEVAGRLGAEFCRALEMIVACRGSVVVSGMGKAGLIGRKIAATLASTGTRSHFLHPAEAVHGDLGRLAEEDLVLLFSSSGETEEITRLLPSLEDLGAGLIAVTCRSKSTLARAACVVLDLGPLEEAGPLGLAPSTSTMAMLAVGDALALVASGCRGFGPSDFARYHPGGSLGLKLSSVDDHMRPLAQCRVALASQSVREVFVQQSLPGRRSGAIMLVDGQGTLRGLFTDSDLARLFETRRERDLDRPISELMTRAPCCIRRGERMTAAVEMLAGKKISELPVVDEGGRPVGLIDITDVVGETRELAVRKSA